jgi:hypothetical protein
MCRNCIPQKSLFEAIFNITPRPVHIWKVVKEENLGSFLRYSDHPDGIDTIYRIAVYKECLKCGTTEITERRDFFPVDGRTKEESPSKSLPIMECNGSYTPTPNQVPPPKPPSSIMSGHCYSPPSFIFPPKPQNVVKVDLIVEENKKLKAELARLTGICHDPDKPLSVERLVWYKSDGWGHGGLAITWQERAEELEEQIKKYREKFGYLEE